MSTSAPPNDTVAGQAARRRDRPARRGAPGEAWGRRVVASFIDVTARREAEARLRASEERYRQIEANAPISLALASLDGRWLRVNRVVTDGRARQLWAGDVTDRAHAEQALATVAALVAHGLAFCLLTFAWLTGYALVVARAGDFLRRPAIRRALEGVTGAVLIALGVRVATEHR